MEKVIIIGAGPAGLTAAFELLSRSGRYEVLLLEETGECGGIARTVNRNGNRMDLGGHRFFSKVPEVNAWWENMLPLQGSPSRDDLIFHREAELREYGPDPEREDRVMLRRKRTSRIYFNGRFFDYPLRINRETLRGMGPGRTVAAGCSYLKSAAFPRQENSLEDFYINRFGKKLYTLFFKNYTENLWGRHPNTISPAWGIQRVKGLSIRALLKNVLRSRLRPASPERETSLIGSFSYPKLGAGQLWEQAALEIERRGGTILKETRVLQVKREGNRATGVVCEKDGGRVFLPGDYILSSMPLKDLAAGLDDVPAPILEIARGLPYRNFITVGVLADELLLKNETDYATVGNIIPDQWIYMHDPSVKMGRIQIYNNWSPYMLQDPEHTVWMGLEYFCGEDDSLWNLSDEELGRMAVRELIRLKFISSEDKVRDLHVERVRKAYPAYFDTYDRIGELRDYLDTIPNLFCIGRNGQHRYNNMDHSMCTAFEAVDCILNGRTDKSGLWEINTENVYHEE